MIGRTALAGNEEGRNRTGRRILDRPNINAVQDILYCHNIQTDHSVVLSFSSAQLKLYH